LNCSKNCELWHSPNQAAAILCVSRRTVYYLMKLGILKYQIRKRGKKKIGRRIQHPELERYAQLVESTESLAH